MGLAPSPGSGWGSQAGTYGSEPTVKLLAATTANPVTSRAVIETYISIHTLINLTYSK